jgi:hypothetical protein
MAMFPPLDGKKDQCVLAGAARLTHASLLETRNATLK